MLSPLISQQVLTGSMSIEPYRSRTALFPAYSILQAWVAKQRPNYRSFAVLACERRTLLTPLRSSYCGATEPTAGDTAQFHSRHHGILRCRLCVSSAVWWPSIKHQVEQLVKSCLACTKVIVAHRQPMIASPLPNHPWDKVASDLFELNGKTYLLVADYFSCYLEVQTLTTTTSASVIHALKVIFSRHGIPAVLMSDNGPQYSSQEMKDFSINYNFKHVTSSPHSKWKHHFHFLTIDKRNGGKVHRP